MSIMQCKTDPVINHLTDTILRESRDRISEESSWTKGAYSRDKDGNALENISMDNGVCFCTLGSIHKTIYDMSHEIDDETRTRISTAYTAALGLLSLCVYGGTVVYFNDDPQTTHKDVLTVFDKAIKKNAAFLGMDVDERVSDSSL